MDHDDCNRLSKSGRGVCSELQRQWLVWSAGVCVDGWRPTGRIWIHVEEGVDAEPVLAHFALRIDVSLHYQTLAGWDLAKSLDRIGQWLDDTSGASRRVLVLKDMDLVDADASGSWDMHCHRQLSDLIARRAVSLSAMGLSSVAVERLQQTMIVAIAHRRSCGAVRDNLASQFHQTELRGPSQPEIEWRITRLAQALRVATAPGFNATELARRALESPDSARFMDTWVTRILAENSGLLAEFSHSGPRITDTDSPNRTSLCSTRTFEIEKRKRQLRWDSEEVIQKLEMLRQVVAATVGALEPLVRNRQIRVSADMDGVHIHANRSGSQLLVQIRVESTAGYGAFIAIKALVDNDAVPILDRRCPKVQDAVKHVRRIVLKHGRGGA